VRRFRYLALSVLAIGLATLFAPTAAHAAVTPGAWCKKAETGAYGQSTDGDWYRCTLNAGATLPKWMPSSPPPPGQNPSAPAPSKRTPDGPCLDSEAGQEFSTSAGKLYVCQKKGTSYAWTLVTGGDDQPGTLPKTGVDGRVAAAAGTALVAAGGGLFWAMRRRRVSFQA
jgi:LPXTG-motif cell wall-anchored protein